MFRRLLHVFCLVLVVGRGAAAEPGWPLVAGSLKGELALFGEDGPRLRWQAEALRPDEPVRRFSFRVDADEFQTRGGAEWEISTGALTWRIEEGTVALSTWLSRVATRLALPLDGIEAVGLVTFDGEGGWAEGAPTGVVRVRWADGVVRSAAGDWELAGIQGMATYGLDGTGEATLTARALRYGLLRLQDGTIGVRLGGDLQASISRLDVRGLGGRIAFSPFAVSLAEPVAEVTIRVSQLALQDLVALLPDALSEARGRIDGELAATWSAAEGLQLGAGWLGLSEGGTASVRLAPVPGMITSQLKTDNPAYAPLQRVELGRTALDVSRLRASFTPRGDAEGRTATVRLHAEPVDPQLKAPLMIDVNVAGPLDQLIKLGMDGRIRF